MITTIEIGCSSRSNRYAVGQFSLCVGGRVFLDPRFRRPCAEIRRHREVFAGAADLGKSRGICVGTEEECKSKSKAKDAPGEKSSLDMLINFGLDSAELDTTARAELGEFAKALKDNRLSTFNFVVEGFTDATGTVHYNEGLSQRRAQSVAAFLTASGVEAARINAIGMGEKTRAAPTRTIPSTAASKCG